MAKVVSHNPSISTSKRLIRVIAALALAACSAAPPVEAQQLPGTEWRIIDGDTMEHLATGITYRPANFDTPEVAHRAECDAEREAGEHATAEVRAIFNAAERIDVRATGRLDRYGRTVAFIAIDGRDLGDILIERRLARPWRGRREQWCGPSGELLP